jgi:hypothetical protein
MKWLRLLAISAVLAQDDDDEADSNGWKKTTNEKGQRVQQLQVMAPALSEQDQKDARLPEQYRCDACMAVGYQIQQKFDKKGKKNMKSWDVMELVDDTCKEAGFPGYGVKLVDGENALSGPGIERDESLQPGGASIQMGGESWSRRLASECKEIVYDLVGEDEVFEMYKGKDFGKNLCKASGHCSGKASEGKKKEKKKEDKKSEKKADKKPDKKTEKKAEKKEAKAPKADPKKDPITFEQYVKTLPSRGLAGSDVFTKKRTQKAWDVELIKLSGKLSASAIEASDEL